ncbi:NAD(P)-dependent oxidoreductase [Pseudoalteromonas piscicida]|uniref:NAD-dependent epimerase/dehydratase domain-containing protein n=1 Tax=Pseudoalteromonas piscicida TaxID=43662 RepID=A0ABN5CPT4_PSEO7|nr:NAD(P)-dependent oxidoreductase [Pseudoalteromonas piscicida]ATD08971.1 hypothetical protein PPIS_a4328 [Pseudoalteromonas piscicida]WPU30946.1 NAD(P)-dependent oxidoreductase [Pseudoalteromonas piscicida]
MENYTVFGGSGFIGREVVSRLEKKGANVFVPKRNDLSVFERDLGHIIYSAGYGNCQKSPFNVIEANLSLLNNVLNRADYSGITYISSTRLYLGQSETREDSNLVIQGLDQRRLFNLSKLAAEELCLKSDSLIVRPSNVYGTALESDLFLPSIIKDALVKKVVNMYVTKSYSKDYVYVGDVADSIIKLIENNVKGIVNVASGKNVCAGSIADILEEKTNTKINWHVEEDFDEFSEIDVEKINGLLDYNPRSVLKDMELMIESYRASLL